MKDKDNIATKDHCPDWAVELISKILVLEVEAGTIKSPGDQSTDSNWATTEIDKLMKVASRLDLAQGNTSTEVSSTVESLFVKVVQGLHREGHSAVVIADMINARIPTGCRLPYCDASEVVGALSDGS